MDLSKPPTGSDPLLIVRCDSWRDFVEHYAKDIGSGGMFVGNEYRAAPLSTLDVRLQLPEATEIVLRARVVQVLDAEQANIEGKTPGIGLELLDMEPERRRQIYQLIEFARWQSATNDPNASFARTLLEISPSLAPAEIGHRLSLLPAALTGASESSSATRRPSESSTTTRRSSESSSGTKRTGESSASTKRSGESSSSTKRPSGGASTGTSGASDPRFRAAGSAGSATPAPPATPPKPTDPVMLKLLLTEFAHKHYEAGLRIAGEMLGGNPGDRQALRWLHMCNARLALTRKDALAAADHYEQALVYGDDNREAREFVRNTRREQKLNSLPFGRYFMKKK